MDARAVATNMIRVVYQDDHYLIARKPAGLPMRTQRRGVPAGLVEALIELGYGTEKGDLTPCFLLEKYVSGLVIVAKTPQAGYHMQRTIESGGLTRSYVAVVRGDARVALKKGSVEVVKQSDKRALIRYPHTGKGGRSLRELLIHQRIPILGDTQFDPRRKGRHGGRMYLHLERLQFDHPLENKPVNVSAPMPSGFNVVANDAETMREDVEAALAGRTSFLLDTRTDAYRLMGGRSDGVSGLILDRLGPVGILLLKEGKFQGGEDRARRAAGFFAKELGLQSVYMKWIPRDRSHGVDSALGDARSATPLWGQPAPEEVTIRENGMNLLVRPFDGFMTGVFLDHRDNRARIREISRGRRVLNAFSYTCAFSVAAALGGAEQVSSVDISKRNLEWGKANFAANNISLDGHYFFCSEIYDFFTRARRQERMFDVVILDPPTFSRSKKPPRTFRVQDDMASLIRESLTVLDKGGTLMVATNERLLDVSWIRQQISVASGGRAFKVVDVPDPPIDFEHDSDAAKTVFASFDG